MRKGQEVKGYAVLKNPQNMPCELETTWQLRHRTIGGLDIV